MDGWIALAVGIGVLLMAYGNWRMGYHEGRQRGYADGFEAGVERMRRGSGGYAVGFHDGRVQTMQELVEGMAHTVGVEPKED